MKCRECGHRYPAADERGPGGSNSPGQYNTASLLAALTGVVLHFLGVSGGLQIALLVAAAFFLYSLCHCGYWAPGSDCPECKHKNWIWPWNF